jgi:hypothetical protein
MPDKADKAAQQQERERGGGRQLAADREVVEKAHREIPDRTRRMSRVFLSALFMLACGRVDAFPPSDAGAAIRLLGLTAPAAGRIHAHGRHRQPQAGLLPGGT